MSLRDHAIVELEAIGYSVAPGQPDGPNKWVVENVLELIDTFAKQGHSGSSAPYVAGLFSKLAAYEPLKPLTGDDSEWVEVAHDTWQNKRCSRVFKGADGKAYDIEGIVFYDILPDGGKSHFTCKESRMPVTFPYTPTTSYMRRDPARTT